MGELKVLVPRKAVQAARNAEFKAQMPVINELENWLQRERGVVLLEASARDVRAVLFAHPDDRERFSEALGAVVRAIPGVFAWEAEAS
jgi:uncharacterized membrane protein